MGDHLLRQTRRVESADSDVLKRSPLELTMELMGFNPFNPKVLAEGAVRR